MQLDCVISPFMTTVSIEVIYYTMFGWYSEEATYAIFDKHVHYAVINFYILWS